jgi:hypothetical protein
MRRACVGPFSPAAPRGRYEFSLPNGLHVVAAAAVAAGQLYLASGAAPDARWPAAAPRLRPAIASFQLGASAGRV